MSNTIMDPITACMTEEFLSGLYNKLRAKQTAKRYISISIVSVTVLLLLLSNACFIHSKT